MARLKWTFPVLPLCAAGAAAAPGVSYRITAIDADPPGTDLNATRRDRITLDVLPATGAAAVRLTASAPTAER